MWNLAKYCLEYVGHGWNQKLERFLEARARSFIVFYMSFNNRWFHQHQLYKIFLIRLNLWQVSSLWFQWRYLTYAMADRVFVFRIVAYLEMAICMLGISSRVWLICINICVMHCTRENKESFSNNQSIQIMRGIHRW